MKTLYNKESGLSPV